MCKTKRFLILVPVLAVVLLFGIMAGVVFAQNGNDGHDPNQDILARVAQILGIDQQKLADAFNQARTEFEAQRLDKLVQDGKITQEQADQLKAWEAARPDPKSDPQKFEEWLKSRPDIPFMGPPGPPPNMDEMLDKLVQDGKITQEQADQLKTWEAAKPDPKADPQKFEEWLKSRPNIPSLRPPGPPTRLNMNEMLDNLVKDGKITQEQADQLKAWEAARPDPKADPQKFDEWLKSRPNIPFPEPPGPPPFHGGHNCPDWQGPAPQ